MNVQCAHRDINLSAAPAYDGPVLVYHYHRARGAANDPGQAEHIFGPGERTGAVNHAHRPTGWHDVRVFEMNVLLKVLVVLVYFVGRLFISVSSLLPPTLEIAHSNVWKSSTHRPPAAGRRGLRLLRDPRRWVWQIKYCCRLCIPSTFVFCTIPFHGCLAPISQVCKGMRQGRKGICVIAGDISPIDVISHMAYYCEEQGVNYM